MKQENKKLNIFDNIRVNNEKKNKFFQKIEFLFGNRIIDVFLQNPTGCIIRKFLPGILTDQHINQLVAIDLEIMEHFRSFNKKMPSFIITKNKHNQKIKLVYFNTSFSFLKNYLKVGKKYRITGTLNLLKGELQIIHPESVLEDHKVIEFEEYEPVYNLGRMSINKKQFRKLIKEFYISLKNSTFPGEWIELKYIKNNGWNTFQSSLINIHFPRKQNSDPEKFRKRLAFDEILSNFLILSRIRLQKKIIRKITINQFNYSEKIVKNLKFNLTPCQKIAYREIRNDLITKKMFRLLQGDVGSGKTIVAGLAIADTINSGYQVALMVPTEILANQHLEYFKKILKDENINIVLLSGKKSQKEKKDTYKLLKEKKIDLLIGTHSIFNKDVEFQNLGLIVIDEQHKFGVKQRLSLQKKDQNANILIMSATPIPRSLTFAIYGEIDLSTLKQKPPGRKNIKTIIISNRQIPNLIDGIKRKIQNKEKIFWVVPEIGKEDNLTKTENILTRSSFLENIFKKKIGVIHGKMKKDEINNIMNEFKEKELMILLSTSLIEVGIDIPNATTIIIEHANYFGLAQLHQLRGRVGRGNFNSDCVLIHHNDISQNGIDRLLVMKKSNDGFYIAEQDLKIRGSGELFGTKQTGLPAWKFFNPYVDIDIIDDVRINCENLKKWKTLNNEKISFLTSIFFKNEQIEKYFAG